MRDSTEGDSDQICSIPTPQYWGVDFEFQKSSYVPPPFLCHPSVTPALISQLKFKLLFLYWPCSDNLVSLWWMPIPYRVILCGMLCKPTARKRELDE